MPLSPAPRKFIILGLFSLKRTELKRNLNNLKYLNQWFSNLSAHQNYLKDVLELPTPRVSAGLGWGQRSCISNKWPGDTAGSGDHTWRTIDENNWIFAPLPFCPSSPSTDWARRSHNSLPECVLLTFSALTLFPLPLDKLYSTTSPSSRLSTSPENSLVRKKMTFG